MGKYTKYSIADLIEEKASKTQRTKAEIKAELAKKVNRSPSLIRKWANYRSHEQRQIPSDFLYILANYFQCRMEDLFNNK